MKTQDLIERQVQMIGHHRAMIQMEQARIADRQKDVEQAQLLLVQLQARQFVENLKALPPLVEAEAEFDHRVAMYA